MSIHVMNEVWRCDLDLSPSEMLVLLALADWANDSGVCWPGVESIAKKTRQGGRNTRYILIKLERMGVIFILKPGGGRRVSNTYQINLQSLHRLETLQSSAKTLQSTTENPAIAIAPEPSLTTKEPSYTRPHNFTNDSKSYVKGKSHNVVNKLPARFYDHDGEEPTAKTVFQAQTELAKYLAANTKWKGFSKSKDRAEWETLERSNRELLKEAIDWAIQKGGLSIKHLDARIISAFYTMSKTTEKGRQSIGSPASESGSGTATLDDIQKNNPELYARIIAKNGGNL